jgi:hypothetical protein
MINSVIEINALNENVVLCLSIKHTLIILDNPKKINSITPDANGSIMLTHHLISYVNSGIKHSGAVTSMSTLKMENI